MLRATVVAADAKEPLVVLWGTRPVVALLLLEDVVAGVNDSKFARWLTRHYHKKGIKAETKEIEEKNADKNEGG